MDDLYLYKNSTIWARAKRNKFPKWEIGDIENEAFLQLKLILHRYDPDRGSVYSFALSSLWDPVHRAYCKAHEIVILKRKGQDRQREYIDPWHQLANEHTLMAAPQQIDDKSKRALLLEHWKTDISHLLSRGLTQRQIAYHLGVTESAISQHVRTIRKLID